ncbi:LPP20 family lipoprotein [Ectothiorhodospiraceae bacterium 2226]|nr:LPP20 family lipoprotein [Ectothiorhodospiraceae bacterium 2226]
MSGRLRLAGLAATIGAALLLLGACATAPPPAEEPGAPLPREEPAPATPPLWLAGAPDDTQHLYGRGSGPTLEQAQQAARAEIARIFETHVHDARWDHIHAVDGLLAQSTGRALTSETERVIHGSEIADLWRDPSTGEHYALARLPRATAAAQVRRHVRELEAEGDALLARVQAMHDPLQQLTVLTQGRAIEQRLVPLQRDIAILERDESTLPEPRWGFEARMHEFLAALTLALEAEPPALAPALREAAHALGLRAASGAPLILRVDLELEPLLQEDGWYWQRGQLTLSLWEAGLPARARSWPLKQAGTAPALAERRLQAEAEALLARHLRTLLLGTP